MSVRIPLSMSLMLLGAIGCADSATADVPQLGKHASAIVPEIEICLAPIDPQATEAAFRAALFPNGTNAGLFCTWNPSGSTCTPQSTHLSGVLPFSGAPPAESTCKTTNSLATLKTCDDYAKHLITSALAQGDLLDLLRGATRLGEVMKRPQAAAHYRWSNPQNPFVKWLGSAGIQQAHLTGKCTTGTDDAGNYCLATDPGAPKRATVRGLLRLLNENNGIRVRNGMLPGAADRQAAIFASATGPANAVAAQTGVLGAALGPRVQHADYLATVLALRLLDGSTDEAGTEAEALVEMPGFVPAGTNAEDYSALSGLVQAQEVARRWSQPLEEMQISDLPIATDLRGFFTTLRITAQTANALGRCQVAEELAHVYMTLATANLSSMRFPKPFAMMASHLLNATAFTSYAAHSGYTSFLTQGLLTAGYEECGMHQQYVALATTEDTSVFFSNQSSCVEGGAWTDSAGNEGEIVSCSCSDCDIDCDAGDQGNMGDLEECVTVEPGCNLECLEWEGRAVVQTPTTIDELLDYGTTLSADDEVLGVVAGNIKDAYTALLTSDDNHNTNIDGGDQIYDRTGAPGPSPDGIADLNHGALADGEYPSIVNAGVGLTGCQAELNNVASVWSSVNSIGLDCAGEVGADDVPVDADCVSSTQGTEAFVPYAIAVRACPKYTARTIGVLDSDFYTELDKCATPWSFTQAVEFFLRHSDDDFAEELGVLFELKGAAANFSSEALYLAQPVAGTYRQRAAFASVVGTLEEDTTDNYGQRSGLDKVDLDLATGEMVIGNGLDLAEAFDHLDIAGERGTEIIAGRSKTAWTTCLGGCTDNGVASRRALYYRTIREAIETYRQLGRARIEVQWRRYDGLSCFDSDGGISDGTIDTCDSCVQVTIPADGVPDLDVDGDGVPDLDTAVIDCNGAADLDGDGDATECAELCQHYDAATKIADDGIDRMENLAALLDAHEPLAHNDVDTFILDAKDFAHSVGTQLELDRENMVQREIDWLGYRVGLWYPALVDDAGNKIDAATAVTTRLTELETKSQSVQFEGHVDRYLGRVSDMLTFFGNVDDQVELSTGEKSAYCSGGIGNCDSEWRDDYVDVAEINELIRTKLCNRSIWLYQNGVQNPVEHVIEVDECPQFMTPDLAAMDGRSGYLPLQADRIEAVLREVEVMVTMLDEYIVTVLQPNSRAAAELEEATEQSNAQLMAGLRAAIGCAAAIATAIIEVACVVGTAGVCTPAAAPAAVATYGAAAVTCGALIGQSAVDIHEANSRAELAAAYNAYSASIQRSGDLFEVSERVSGLITLSANYEIEVQQWQNLMADYERTVAYNNTVFESLVGSPVFDPTVQLFYAESLGALEDEFRGYAQTAREAHHALQYSLGQPVREGGTFKDGIDTYQLPRLSEITIFKSYGAGYTTAHNSLKVDVSGELLDGERGKNLVAYAAVLDKIHAKFKGLYGGMREETPAPAYVGSLITGMPFIDTNGDGQFDAADRTREEARADNGGEWAMLGGSPFFDPDGAGAQKGTLCGDGQVDLTAYCSEFEDGGDIALDPCLDVAALDVQHRYNLLFMDFVLHGANKKTFTCHSSSGPSCAAYDENGECPQPLPSVSPYITVADSPDGDGIWEDDEIGNQGPLVDTSSTYYLAQTPTVRNILRRWFDEVARQPGILAVQDLDTQPGAYLFLINMSTGAADPQGYSSADFDPEASILYGGGSQLGPQSTISEHVTSMALACIDSTSCPNDFDSIGGTVFMLGRGYLGDRCLHRDETTRQERVAFEMGTEAVGVPFKRVESFNTLNDEMADVLDGNRGQLDSQPLHTNGWIVSLPGVRQSTGAAWAGGPLTLYRHGGEVEGMRLQVALYYSYFDETAASLNNWPDDVAGMLACAGPSDAVCVNGSCP